MTKTKPEPGDPENALITAAELAHMVDRSVRWVHMLREAGKIEPIRRGLYQQGPALRAALQAIEEGLRSKAQRTKQASATTEARTREVELRVAEREAQLIAVSDVLAVLRTMTSIVKAEFAALPSLHTANPDRRRELQAEVHKSFARMDAQLAKVEREVTTGK
ncbi:MAG: hypothetical protein B7Y80_20090 [Hyphomicrobium sp. 32-62-53]|nr:MAG: hypothetical protein B7Z29_19920 [Hyphomicrobium sp. 12-62-95]OYX97334.1 MAG: hypothetical protein B7Y80_20090 [Hyphomicrobium sp. 32-62-53]